MMHCCLLLGSGKGGFLVLKHYRTEDSSWGYGLQSAKNCLAALLFFCSQNALPRGHFLRNSMSPCISWLSCRTTYEKYTAHHRSLCTAKTSIFQQLFFVLKQDYYFSSKLIIKKTKVDIHCSHSEQRGGHKEDKHPLFSWQQACPLSSWSIWKWSPCGSHLSGSHYSTCHYLLLISCQIVTATDWSSCCSYMAFLTSELSLRPPPAPPPPPLLIFLLFLFSHLLDVMKQTEPTALKMTNSSVSSC